MPEAKNTLCSSNYLRLRPPRCAVQPPEVLPCDRNAAPRVSENAKPAARPSQGRPRESAMYPQAAADRAHARECSSCFRSRREGWYHVALSGTCRSTHLGEPPPVRKVVTGLWAPACHPLFVRGSAADFSSRLWSLPVGRGRKACVPG